MLIYMLFPGHVGMCRPSFFGNGDQNGQISGGKVGDNTGDENGDKLGDKTGGQNWGTTLRDNIGGQNWGTNVGDNVGGQNWETREAKLGRRSREAKLEVQGAALQISGCGDHALGLENLSRTPLCSRCWGKNKKRHTPRKDKTRKCYSDPS